MDRHIESADYNFLTMKTWRVYAGPFRDAPFKGVFNVNLQAEPQEGYAPIHYRLPIQDFGIPTVRAASFACAMIIYQKVARRREVYIGCRGGIGRTGLVLSLLTKIIFNVSGKDAIHYVRMQYYREAVETSAQQKFIEDFPVRSLRYLFKACKIVSSLY